MVQLLVDNGTYRTYFHEKAEKLLKCCCILFMSGGTILKFVNYLLCLVLR